MKIRTLPIDEILATTDTQPRSNINIEVVEEYAEALKNGAIMPPIVVFNEGEGSQRYYLADGFHRLFAHRDAGRASIECEVRDGGLDEAKMFSWGANATHGLRRTRKDIKRAVMIALEDPLSQSLTQQDVADICHVGLRTVQRYQAELTANQADAAASKKRDKTPENKQDPGEDDVRPTATPATQQETHRTELRSALSAIRAFPFGGEAIDDKEFMAELTDDDRQSLEYVSAWCSHAALALKGF